MKPASNAIEIPIERVEMDKPSSGKYKAPWRAEWAPLPGRWWIYDADGNLLFHVKDKEVAMKAAAAPELYEALSEYLYHQRRMLEKWADGDENVKADLWKNLHACEHKADKALAKARGESEK